LISKRVIKQEDKIPIRFSEQERNLLLEHTLILDDELTDPLEQALAKEGMLTVHYSLDDLDDLLGYVAAEANHSKDKNIKDQLEALIDRLDMIEDSYSVEED